MTVTIPRTSSGMTSGTGLAMAKTMGRLAIRRMSLAEATPGPDSPMKTSAPLRASPTVPRRRFSFVCAANQVFIGFMFSWRPA